MFPSLTSSNDPEKIPALPLRKKFLDLEKFIGSNSLIFFQSFNLPKNSLILLIPSSVVKTGSFGIFIFWNSLDIIIDELLPINFSKSKNFKRSGKAGIFAGSLELAKEGDISIKQKNLFDDIFIKENKWKN